MHWDFWNNPLIVTSLRIRYRRGGLMNLMTAYFLVLVAGSVLLFYYRDRFAGPFPRNLLLGVLGVQFLISFMMASSITSQSLRNEVANRTLDFQRIATLSPFQILLGKLLGEPVLAFFSIIATIPIAVYACLILGVEGMTSFGNFLLVYATLVTTTVLSGATGLLQPLEQDPNGKTKPANNLGAILFGSLFCAVPVLVLGGQSILSTGWSAAILGILTPIPTYVGIFHGDPWKYRMEFYGREIPFFVLTPLMQLAMVGLIVHAMMRRLVNPSRTILSRPLAYLLLFACDLIVGGVFYDGVPPNGLGLYAKSAAFWLVHMIFGLLLITMVTPSRDTLWSWLWRFRGQRSWVGDSSLGERSVNTLVLVIMAGLGLIDYFAMLVVPARTVFAPDEVNRFMPEAIQIAVACTTLFLAAGSLFQWLIIAFDRSGRGFFFTLLVLLVMPVHLAGYYFHIGFLLALAPSDHFRHWFSPKDPEPAQSLIPMIGFYAVILLLTQVWTHRRIAAMNRVVLGKLRTMGVKSEEWGVDSGARETSAGAVES
ncbi:MAG TPA: hypothetical protein VGP68_12945 [Gemmataceae bacterium]|nr:hypothetical protein [Gemmataceae bacterium]